LALFLLLYLAVAQKIHIKNLIQRGYAVDIILFRILFRVNNGRNISNEVNLMPAITSRKVF
jgi:hypothetical protein